MKKYPTNFQNLIATKKLQELELFIAIKFFSHFIGECLAANMLSASRWNQEMIQDAIDQSGAA